MVVGTMFSRTRTSERESGRRRPSAALVVAVAGVTLALGSIAYAAIPSGTGAFRGCYAIQGSIYGQKGALRVVEEGEACRAGERLVTSNQQDPQGVPGVNGTNGTNGANGVSGYEVVTSSTDWPGG
jgi:hypothetical protein